MKPEDLDRQEILMYLRSPELDASLNAMLDDCMEKLCAAAQPRVIWRILPVQQTEHGAVLGGLPLGGRDIALHLSGCDAAVLLAATLSAPADALIRRAEVGDMTRAVMLDAVAGAAIEHVCNELEQGLKRELDYPYFTERYSAGYGDFPLSQQRDLIQLLDATRKIGLTVTPQNTLLPMKSVTAVIGLSHEPVKDARRYCCGKSCGECPNRDGCAFFREEDLPNQEEE